VQAYTSIRERPFEGLGYGSFEASANDLMFRTRGVDLSNFRLRHRGAQCAYRHARGSGNPGDRAVFGRARIDDAGDQALRGGGPQGLCGVDNASCAGLAD
jgi:hypothetical protein